MTNALYDATVAHVRWIDPPHAFAHRVYLWLVDLDAPPRPPSWLRPFGSRDHFAAGDPRGIREQLDGWLAERGVDLRGGRVVMLAEMHNTYRGRHAYLLRTGEDGPARAAKGFAVSPLQRMDGEYRMHLPRPEALLALTVALHRGTAAPLAATLRGVRRPVNPRWPARPVPAWPLFPQRVSALIRRHGVALWLRKAAVAPRTPQNAGGQPHG
ncbi:hypothetical protein SAMN04489730_4167 [Amycolatopsis australiensis]|uniref:Uncharacterized protein n=1 Tax=Amycolatopsis australiensis TaxID=546364 RepID=A0A1K1RXT4_9PSEU|nr:hypothetical protein SAMN04489730_4167 [Amycolatopsis australiensis]